MPNYEVEYEYKITEWGAVELQADNPDQADEFGREYVYETIPDATDITVNSVREIKNGK